MKDVFKICKQRGLESYYITYKGKQVTMKYIPKMIKHLTAEVLWKMGEYNGKIINTVPGRLIIFPTQEDAQNAANYLSGKMIMESFE
jgi:Rad3-related DNA helicase